MRENKLKIISKKNYQVYLYLKVIYDKNVSHLLRWIRNFKKISEIYGFDGISQNFIPRFSLFLSLHVLVVYFFENEVYTRQKKKKFWNVRFRWNLREKFLSTLVFHLLLSTTELNSSTLEKLDFLELTSFPIAAWKLAHPVCIVAKFLALRMTNRPRFLNGTEPDSSNRATNSGTFGSRPNDPGHVE